MTIDWDPAAERFVSEGTHRGRQIDINAPRTLPEGEGRHGPSGYSASELLLAAAQALAGVVTDAERNAAYIVPSVFHPDVAKVVATAVARAARSSGPAA